MSTHPGPPKKTKETVLPKIDIDSVVRSLNPAQRQAVTHDPKIPLQILAGPGSGKTRVLTSRIAHLILAHSMDPASICAVTFTNKAANEMRDRLQKLIGKERTAALKMGTFHAICVRFLRMHSSSVGLDTNFTVCDADDSKKLIGELMKPYKDYMAERDIAFTEGTVASVISKAKAKGCSASDHLADVQTSDKKGASKKQGLTLHDGAEETKSAQRVIAEIYVGYEKVLKDNNALDFDDLLVYGVKLFTGHKETTLWCRHILVDEFQDTNTMQYELMRAIAIRKCVTIVGDPDQSIYGWRSAEVINLSKMRKEFPNTVQIFLEENYRSTAAILRACLAIVAEDKTRIPKSLRTTHPLGNNPMLAQFDDEKVEAEFIAYEIKRCCANMGGTLKWGDFVILLRFNALSRPIESALQKQGIPCRILGGHKFFERMEIKDMLAYLQLVDNPSFSPAFLRAIKSPARGVGDKTLSELSGQAEKLKISQFEVVERIHDNKIPDIKPPIKRKIASFVQAIRDLRKLDAQKIQPSDLVRKLLDLIKYEEHLRKTQQDWESRWENVQELITFASEVETDSPAPGKETGASGDEPEGSESLLRQFLQSSMLSSEGDNQSEEESKEKVTLSTCHAAKGLEWPVVMIPSVDRDTYPFYRSEDLEEERRLLYVGCTRAQSLLYLLHSKKRVVAGKMKDKSLSAFISVPRTKDEGLFSYEVPRLGLKDREIISGVLGRPVPDEAEVARRIAKLEAAGDRLTSIYSDSHGGFSAIPLTGVGHGVGTMDPTAVYADAKFLTNLSAMFNKDYRAAPFRRPNTGNKPPSSGQRPFPKSQNASSSSSPSSTSSVAGPSWQRPPPKTNFVPNPNLIGGRALVSSEPSANAIADFDIDMDWKPPASGRTSSWNSHGVYPHRAHTSHSDAPVSRMGDAKRSTITTAAARTSALPPSLPLWTGSNNKRQQGCDQNWPPGEGNLLTAPDSGGRGGQAGLIEKPIIRGNYDMKMKTSTQLTVTAKTPPNPNGFGSSPSSRHEVSNGGDPSPVPRLPSAIITTQQQYRSGTASVTNPSSTLSSSTLNVVHPAPPTVTNGVKRRLGMGRSVTGYSNKKFKPPA